MTLCAHYKQGNLARWPLCSTLTRISSDISRGVQAKAWNDLWTGLSDRYLEFYFITCVAQDSCHCSGIHSHQKLNVNDPNQNLDFRWGHTWVLRKRGLCGIQIENRLKEFIFAPHWHLLSGVLISVVSSWPLGVEMSFWQLRDEKLSRLILFAPAEKFTPREF